MRKVVKTSSGTFLPPVFPDSLIIDEVPTQGSFNAVSSDGVAKAVIQAGAELPTRGTTDTGKVLTVANSDGDLVWSAPSEVTVDQVYDSTSENAQSGVAVASAVSGKQDTISDLSTIRSGAALGATAVQPGSLATVATSGSYTDLSNKPTIPAAQVNADWNSSSGVSEILNKPSLATVATSGSYNDLTNKPTIPAAVTVDQSYNASSTNAQSGVAVAQAIASVPSASYTAGDGIDITNDTISAKIGNGLEIDSYTTRQTVTRNLSVTSSSSETQLIGTLSSEIKDRLDYYNPITITTNRAYTFSTAPVGDVYLAIAMNGNPSQYRLVGAPAITVDENNSIQPGSFTFDRASVVSAMSNTNWNNILNDTTNEYDFIFFGADGYNYIAAKATVQPSTPTVVATASFRSTVTIQNAINVANPIPAFSSSDNGKVLGVVDGELAWVLLT